VTAAGRPRKEPNGKGSTFTRERKAAGEVVTVVVHLERATLDAVQVAATANERSVAAQIRWLIKQAVAGQTPPREDS
jgi:hypothetical protein